MARFGEPRGKVLSATSPHAGLPHQEGQQALSEDRRLGILFLEEKNDVHLSKNA